MANISNVSDDSDIERRVNGERRNGGDRRMNFERRYDFRDKSCPERRPKTIKVWLRSVTHSRLGVDRRKGDRRSGIERRQFVQLHGLLSQDEISDLLSL